MPFLDNGYNQLVAAFERKKEEEGEEGEEVGKEVGGHKCCLHRERGAGWPGGWDPYSEVNGLGLGRLVLETRGWGAGKGSSGDTSLEQRPK